MGASRLSSEMTVGGVHKAKVSLVRSVTHPFRISRTVKSPIAEIRGQILNAKAVVQLSYLVIHATCKWPKSLVRVSRSITKCD